MSRKDYLKSDIIPHIPLQPGVYQYFDVDGKIIYVGKAKSLRKRVQSYFNRDKDLSGKTRVLVSRIHEIKYIVVETEFDALLLENNLIKKYQPKYNIQLRDDKTYPWICIKNERFPRVFSTRNPIKDGSIYFGPYASGRMMNTLLDFVRELFPLRTCNFDLNQDNIEQGKFKVCLDYHIGKCKGPCEGFQSEEDYRGNIEQIKHILKGNLKSVSDYLKENMAKSATEMDFEMAQNFKEKLDIIQRYQSKSTVVSSSIKNLDVFGYEEDTKKAYINFLKVIDGAIIQSHTIELKKQLDETPEDLLAAGMIELRDRFDSNSREIIVPFVVDIEGKNFEMKVPQRGDRKNLLELSQRNLKYYLLDKKKRNESIKKNKEETGIAKIIQNDLNLKEPVHRIECFDNSNFQGTNPVAACVVFENGKPKNSDYRHYKVKTVEGPDDFASMREIVYRRYKRQVDEGNKLPQLIVIDGGKGQLSAAVSALKEAGVYGKVAIIGIAKRLEEIFFPGDSIPIYLDKTSTTLKVIQHCRNEAHRFGITFHRDLRSKNTFKTALQDIDGIGLKTAQVLLRKFKSVKKIEEASFDELKAEVGKAKAEVVYAHFH